MSRSFNKGHGIRAGRAVSDGRVSGRVCMIDRDGVINRYCPGEYVSTVDNFEFLPRSLDALRLLNKNGFRVVIISNQAGVGKGYMAPGNLHRITSYMLSEVERHGGHIDKVIYCVHVPEDECDCRKPRPGMIFAAARHLEFDPADAWFVGDSDVDAGAAAAAGCRFALVFSGKTGPEDLAAWTRRPDWTGDDLMAAVRHILAESGE